MQVQIKVEDASLRDLMALLKVRVPQALTQAKRRGYARIKQKALAEAQDNAPISPSKGQYEASLIRGAVGKQAYVKLRFSKDGKPIIGTSKLKSKRTDFTPGGLVDSIQGLSNDQHAEIFVASNARAGKYAFYIEEQGSHGTGKWQKRGIGTVRKGARADDKFIARAVNDNVETFKRYLNEEIDHALKAIG